MLTTQELEKLRQLVAGKRPPSDGMETHFLRVINGDALPCSPKEREWYQYWRQKSGTAEEADDCPEGYREAICAVRQRDAIIASLEGQMRDKDAIIEALRKEVAILEGFLKNAHKALEEYEPISSPLVTDVQAANERKMRHAEQKASYHFTKGIYSSTDGQE